VAQLRRHREAFARLGAGILLLTFCTRPAAQAYLAEMKVPFDLLLDTRRDVYRRYGLERSFWRSWTPKLIWRYAHQLATKGQFRRSRGDPTQLGGDFIIDRTGIVRLAYRSRTALDRPSAAQLLDELGHLR
jgi:peroxiredoxin